MAKEKKNQPKMILERQYVVPLRHGWLKVARFKRANRAVTELKKFIAKHMKIYDRDLRKIKIDVILNNEIRFRGMAKPPAKILVNAKKFDNDIVIVELVNIPAHIKFARLSQDKKLSEVKKVEEKKVPEEVKKEESEEKKVDAKEKEEASREETLEISKKQALDQKHVVKDKKVVMHRKAMSR